MTVIAQKIGFIGGGAMAEALSKGIIDAGLVDPSRVLVSDINKVRLDYIKARLGVETAGSNEELVQAVDVVVLAVKPHVVAGVLAGVAPLIQRRQLVVSIVTGATIPFLEQQLQGEIPVVRVMPNTPCLVGAGASAFTLGSHAQPEHGELVQTMLQAVGRCVMVPEQLLNSVTGLSGSGPAYIYVAIEALADAGVQLGIPADMSLILAAQTVMGAAKMVLETGEIPARLKNQVTTPGGTTAAGLYALEKGRLRATMADAVLAAARRAEELAGGKG